MDPVNEQQVIRDLFQQSGQGPSQEPPQRRTMQTIHSMSERGPCRVESNSSFDNVYGNRDGYRGGRAAPVQRPSSSFEKIFGSGIGGGDHQPATTASQRNRFYHMKSDIFSSGMSPQGNKFTSSARPGRQEEVTGKITQAVPDRGDSAFVAGESSRSDALRKNARESCGNPLNMMGYASSPRRTCRKHFAQSYH